MSVKAFWTTFIDGLTGEGLCGDLSIPGFPTKMFRPEHEPLPESDAVFEETGLGEPVCVLHPTGMFLIKRADGTFVEMKIQDAIEAARKGRQIKIVIPETKEPFRHAAG